MDVVCNILCVGTELLLGQIQDTNSTYIAGKLLDSGIPSYEHRHVGDNEQRIEKALLDLLDVSDFVIVTGGLGPTHDDITREVTAKVMGASLVLDPKVEQQIRERFARRNKDMPINNLRQAMVPQGATVIENPSGTAPGLICPYKDKWIYLVPGVPSEMEPMVADTIIGHIPSRIDSKSIVVRSIRTLGMAESELVDLLEDFVVRGETEQVKVSFLAQEDRGVAVKLSAIGDSKQECENLIAAQEQKILEILGDHVFGFDEDTIAGVVIDMLKEKNLRVSCAESLTGGMLSSWIVDVEAVSEAFTGGVITYSKTMKNTVLGVDVKDVYSNECALSMARGVREYMGSDIGISTTGVAGPGSDDGHIPGEVYIGISGPYGDVSERFNFSGDRLRVRKYSVISALDMLRKYLG